MIEIKLKELLVNKGKTMADLSRETGISKNALSQLANGESQGIQFNTLEKILDYLNCSIDELIKKRVNTWEEEMLTCPRCKIKSVYEVLRKLQGSEGIFSQRCNHCEENFEVDYYPIIEFKVREVGVDD